MRFLSSNVNQLIFNVNNVTIKYIPWLFFIALLSSLFQFYIIHIGNSAISLAFVSCLLLSLSGVDVFTSIAAVVACMFNIGPGLGNVGPVEHYGHIPALAKWVLSMCMVAGRLEFYTVLVIFTPVFWRR